MTKWTIKQFNVVSTLLKMYDDKTIYSFNSGAVLLLRAVHLMQTFYI